MMYMFQVSWTRSWTRNPSLPVQSVWRCSQKNVKYQVWEALSWGMMAGNIRCPCLALWKTGREPTQTNTNSWLTQNQLGNIEYHTLLRNSVRSQDLFWASSPFNVIGSKLEKFLGNEPLAYLGLHFQLFACLFFSLLISSPSIRNVSSSNNVIFQKDKPSRLNFNISLEIAPCA